MASTFQTDFAISSAGSTVQFGRVAGLQKLQAALVSRSAMVGSLTHAQIVNSMFQRFADDSSFDESSVYALGAGCCGPVEAGYTSPVETWAKTLNYQETSNWAANMGMRIKHPAATISTSGEQVRVTLISGSWQSNFTHVCFAEDAGNCNAAGAFGGSKFKELLFSGSTGVNIAASGTATSDWLDFTVDETLNYMTVIGFPATNANAMAKGTSEGNYTKASASGDYNVQNISGYTLWAAITRCTSQIEVRSSITPQNMSLISNPVTSSRVASQGRGIALIKNIDASSKLYVSQASSPSWTELTNLTLDTAHIGGPGVNLYVSDIVALPYSTDKSMRWKVETDEGNDTRVYTIGWEWI